MNLPNKLTMLRIVLVPVFMVCAAYHWMLAAGVLLLVGCIAEIALRGAHIMQILLGIGFNLAFVAYFFSFRAAAQEA